jgi:hypothetical protein
MDLAQTKMDERFERYVSDEIVYHFFGDNSYRLAVVLKKGKNQHQVCSSCVFEKEYLGNELKMKVHYMGTTNERWTHGPTSDGNVWEGRGLSYLMYSALQVMDNKESAECHGVPHASLIVECYS